MWSTLDIGIKFDKAINIRSQLDKVANGGKPKPASRPADATDPARKSSLAQEPFSPSDIRDGDESASPTSGDPPKLLDDHARFNALKAFYRSQLSQSENAETGLFSGSGLDLGNYSSPSSLARIMNLYSNLGNASSRVKARQKPQPMREALTSPEGLSLPTRADTEASVDSHLTNSHSVNPATTISQRVFQHAPSLGCPNARTVSSLRPLPTLLCTKRAKRCLACKHILTKPEIKPSSTRYRMRLLALSYLPLVSLKPVPTSSISAYSNAVLGPGRPAQWVLTLQNPLFERVKVSLGCPATLPGRRGDRVTILCPQFEIGPSGDVWDEALNGGKASTTMTAAVGEAMGEQVAGKLYESGRNWAGVVLEVVPGMVFGKAKSSQKKKETGSGEENAITGQPEADETTLDTQREQEQDEEDEDLVEIPIRVRLEWRVSIDDGMAKEKKSSKPAARSARLLDEDEGGGDGRKGGDMAVEDDGRRELAYWMVLGVGRVDRVVVTEMILLANGLPSENLKSLLDTQIASMLRGRDVVDVRWAYVYPICPVTKKVTALFECIDF